VKKNEATEIPKIMTVHDAAEYLNCAPVTIQRLVRHGKLPGLRLGRQLRFRREDIDQWIVKRETTAVEIEPGPPRRRKWK
jgi:excisionase family DNA binding protein